MGMLPSRSGAQNSTPPKTGATGGPTSHSTKKQTTHQTPGRTSQHRSTHRTSTRRSSGRQRAATARQRRAQVRPEPERIQEIQKALAQTGYLKAEPSGRWDDSTRDAMRRFQVDHGFTATGLPEAKSLMKLGLGPHPLPEDLDASSGAKSGARCSHCDSHYSSRASHSGRTRRAAKAIHDDNATLRAGFRCQVQVLALSLSTLWRKSNSMPSNTPAGGLPAHGRNVCSSVFSYQGSS